MATSLYPPPATICNVLLLSVAALPMDPAVPVMKSLPLLVSVTVLLTPRIRKWVKFVTIPPLIVKLLLAAVPTPTKNCPLPPFHVVVPLTVIVLPVSLLLPPKVRFPLVTVALANTTVLVRPSTVMAPTPSCPPLVTIKLLPAPLTVTPLPNPVTVPPSTVITPPPTVIAVAADDAARVPPVCTFTKSLSAPLRVRPFTKTWPPLVSVSPLALPLMVKAAGLLYMPPLTTIWLFHPPF